MVLRCECGNETEFYERITVDFIIDAEGNREEKVIEDTHFYCIYCDAEVFMGD